MKTNILTILILSVFVFASCENAKTKENKLQAEVLAEHDVIMAKMDELTEMQSRLDSLKINLGNIKVSKPETDTLALKNTIDSLKTQLSLADDAMMNWMRDFNPDYEGKSHEEIIQYLNEEKTKINAVGVLFEESLSKSSAILSENK